MNNQKKKSIIFHHADILTCESCEQLFAFPIKSALETPTHFINAFRVHLLSLVEEAYENGVGIQTVIRSFLPSMPDLPTNSSPNIVEDYLFFSNEVQSLLNEIKGNYQKVNPDIMKQAYNEALIELVEEKQIGEMPNEKSQEILRGYFNEMTLTSFLEILNQRVYSE